MEPEVATSAATSEPAGAEEHSYPPPVQRLFELRSPRENTNPKLWPEYLRLGIGPEHVPDLIRVMRGWRRHWFDKEETPAVWAHIHAWRALGQLRAVEAIEPLLAVFTETQKESDDWAIEEIPVVLAMIGPAVIEPIVAYLASAEPDTYAKSAAAGALARIAKRDPEQRDRVVGMLTDALARYATQEPELNGLLLGELLQLKAIEAVPVIREAFRADAIDESIAGGWGDVRREFKLERQPDDPPERTARDAWREKYPALAEFGGFTGDRAGGAPAGPHRTIEQRKEADRKRRKRQKQARRQNRKRR